MVKYMVHVVNDHNGRWLPEVLSENATPSDAINGYAGSFGKPITGIALSGGFEYRVHIQGGGWLPPVSHYNIQDSVEGFAGDRKLERLIDGIAISSGDYEYQVHLLGGGWLPPVSGYNILDWNYGCAGKQGYPIDALLIRRKFTFNYEYRGKCINQWADYPDYQMKHGCEIVALQMGLAEQKVERSALLLWNHHVPKNLYKNTPAQGGSCSAECIVRTVDSLKQPITARDITGTPFTSLYQLLNGGSVIFWGTCGPGRRSDFPPYNRNQHVLVLLRGDERSITYKDSWVGEIRQTRDISTVEKAYNAVGKKAVFIYKIICSIPRPIVINRAQEKEEFRRIMLSSRPIHRSNSPEREKRVPNAKVGDELAKPVQRWYVRIPTGGTAEHTGIYIGNDRVIDVGGDTGGKVTSFGLDEWEPTKVNPMSAGAYDRETIADRARAKEGVTWAYDLTQNNCQHFTKWCQTGVFHSYQMPGTPPTREEFYTKEVQESEYIQGLLIATNRFGGGRRVIIR